MQEFIGKYTDALMRIVGDEVPGKDVRKVLNEAIDSEDFRNETHLDAKHLDVECGEYMTLRKMVVTWAEASIEEMRAKKNREKNDRNIANLQEHIRRSQRPRSEAQGDMSEKHMRKMGEGTE